MGASHSNRVARQNYEHQLKVRERKWMQTRTTYATKKVQHQEEVDLANIAAQRAYSRTQQQLKSARSLAILQNQEDFKKMLAAEGAIEVSAAERGVRGKSVARMLVMNQANFGLTQAMRTKGLTEAGWKAKEVTGDVNRQLKSAINRSFSNVAIQPHADIAPPPPVMQNVGMTLMLGMGQALAAGIAGKPKTGDGLKQGGIYQGGDTSFGMSLGTDYGFDPSGAMKGNPFTGSYNAADSFNPWK